MMNWQHLAYFQAMARYQNYTLAAEELYITPSALNKAIHKFEDEIGIQLFQKQGRNSYLTPYGKKLYDCVNNSLEEIENCISDLQNKKSNISGTLHLEGTFTMCADFIPHQMLHFKNQYLNVTATIEYFPTAVILQHLMNSSVDFGFCGDFSIEVYPSLDRILIRQEPLCILVSDDNPLSEKKTISVKELSNYPMIVHKYKGTGTRQVFDKLCETYSLHPSIDFAVPDDQSILGLVQNNLGIALIADVPSLKVPHTTSLYLDETQPYRSQFMVWRRDLTLSPAAKVFRDQIVSSLEKDL
ncbi:MAG: LysR family transcriptional regulator [Lachnospiraceae bacterium]|nr:LysR family transcriptional regulator [Lachnospiraceae bacterium]